MDEFAIIAKLFAPLSGAGAFGLKDDAGVIAPRPGEDLVVTTDTVVEDVDFFATDPPASVAKKALRVSLSDLAAKGAQPAQYLLNLTLSAHIDMAWMEDFARGLAEDQAHFGISLLGGDTGRGPLSITVTGFGHVPRGAMVQRDGARTGDAVFVTGTIGDGGGGLALLRGEACNGLAPAHRNFLIERYRVPAPPVAFGPSLRGLAGAALDISDGLIADLGHIAEASGVRILIDGRRIPRSPALRALWGEKSAAILRAATCGDDYQIAFTAPHRTEVAEKPMVTRIGTVEAGTGVGLIIDGANVPVERPGYRHF